MVKKGYFSPELYNVPPKPTEVPPRKKKSLNSTLVFAIDIFHSIFCTKIKQRIPRTQGQDLACVGSKRPLVMNKKYLQNKSNSRRLFIYLNVLSREAANKTIVCSLVHFIVCFLFHHLKRQSKYKTKHKIIIKHKNYSLN